MDFFLFNGNHYMDGQNFVLLLKFDLVQYPRSYVWEKDSAWRIARDGE
jgi:hypothetical protein